MATIAAEVPLTQAEINALHLALQGVDSAAVAAPLDDPDEAAGVIWALEEAKIKIASLAR